MNKNHLIFNLKIYFAFSCLCTLPTQAQQTFVWKEHKLAFTIPCIQFVTHERDIQEIASGSSMDCGEYRAGIHIQVWHKDSINLEIARNFEEYLIKKHQIHEIPCVYKGFIPVQGFQLYYADTFYFDAVRRHPDVFLAYLLDESTYFVYQIYINHRNSPEKALEIIKSVRKI